MSEDAVLYNAPLASLNTLALPAQAASLLRLTNEAQLEQLPPHHRRLILGGGSNLVLCGDFDGLVLQVCLSGKRLLNEDSDFYYIEAAAGEDWHGFVEWTLAQGWPGLENLALIPGTVGAAPVQNIGAYGLEVGQLIWRVHALDLELHQPREFSQADCCFAYRDSVFKHHGWHRDGRILVTRVVFRLPKRWQANTRYADIARALAERGITAPTPSQIAKTVCAVRRAKLPDPASLPNAGSFFENPIISAAEAARLLARWTNLPHYPQADGQVKIAAGWLIEHAGWKGRRLGPVGMYEKQALVLVNHGGANGTDVQNLLTTVCRDVAAMFTIELHPEPVFIGQCQRIE